MGFNFYKNKTRYLNYVADNFSPKDEWKSEKHAIKRINIWIKSVKQSIPCHLELPKNLATINVYIESRLRHTRFLSFERRVFINHKNRTVIFSYASLQDGNDFRQNPPFRFFLKNSSTKFQRLSKKTQVMQSFLVKLEALKTEPLSRRKSKNL